MLVTVLGKLTGAFGAVLATSALVFPFANLGNPDFHCPVPDSPCSISDNRNRCQPPSTADFHRSPSGTTVASPKAKGQEWA